MMFAWAALVLALPLARAANTPLASGTSISGLWPKHGASAAGATALEVVEEAARTCPTRTPARAGGALPAGRRRRRSRRRAARSSS